MPIAALRSRTTAGWLLVAVSIGLALAAQVASPVRVPLYDGVPLLEPYRFLHPSGDQAGDPTSFTSSPKVTKDISPPIVAATTENGPQAQLIAQEGAFVLPSGVSELRVSVRPIDAPAAPSGREIAGNAYDVSVTDASGSPLLINTSCQGCLTLILRAPEGSESVEIRRFDGAAWQALETVHSGAADSYQVNPTALGTFATIAEGAVGADTDPVILIGVGAVALILIAGALLFFRVSPAAPSTASAKQPSSRVPSKRKAGRRPPAGRTDR